MKWTDLALLFSMIFLATITLMDMSILTRQKSYYSEEMYNRILDRVAYDVLEDGIQTEVESGAILDETRILRNLTEEMTFLFNGHSKEQIASVLSSIRAVMITQESVYHVYENEGGNTFLLREENALEKEMMRQSLESYLPGKLMDGNGQNDELYQDVDKYQIYIIFQGKPYFIKEGNGFNEQKKVNYTRVVRAAARLEKVGKT